MGGDAIPVLVIFSNVKEQQITSFGTLSASFCSSGTQKKEYSETSFGCRDVGDALILDGKATSFMFSASGFQKKERSEMGFVHGDTGDEMNFVGDAIQSDLTC